MSNESYFAGGPEDYGEKGAGELYSTTDNYLHLEVEIDAKFRVRSTDIAVGSTDWEEFEYADSVTTTPDKLEAALGTPILFRINAAIFKLAVDSMKNDSAEDSAKNPARRLLLKFPQWEVE